MKIGYPVTVLLRTRLLPRLAARSMGLELYCTGRRCFTRPEFAIGGCRDVANARTAIHLSLPKKWKRVGTPLFLVLEEIHGEVSRPRAFPMTAEGLLAAQDTLKRRMLAAGFPLPIENFRPADGWDFHKPRQRYRLRLLFGHLER